MSDRPGKIESIHILRGMTIAAIVFRHTLSYFDERSVQTSFAAKVIDELSFNWTVLFVLISGYLFQYLADRFETRRYWRSKLRNVISPYLVVSVAAIGILHWPEVSGLPLYAPGREDVLSWTARMLVTGQHSEPYWYIPMITVIFALGPLLHRLGQRDLTIVGVIGILLSVMTYKPETYETLKNVFHYLPVYVAGMLFCQKRETLSGLVRRNRLVLVLFFLVILGSSLNKKLGLTTINFADDYLMTLQKIVLFLLLLSWLEDARLPHPIRRLFAYLADISFPIYFIHMIVVHSLLPVLETREWWERAVSFESGLSSALMNGVFTVVVLTISAGIIEAVKRLAGKRSRLLIGG